MSYPKINAPLTNRKGYLNSDAIVFDVETLATGVKLSWGNLPFTAGSLPHMVAVGKEYGTQDVRYHDKTDFAVECPTQALSCIPDPDTVQPVGYPHQCWSGIWDTGIAFVNYQAGGVLSITIDFNKFMLAGSSAAFQTDGKEATYYVELSQIVGASAVKTKWTFKYTTPVAPFEVCGAGEVVVPPPPPVTEPPVDAHPGKGNEKKK